MSLPTLLDEHIDFLKSEGYTVEVSEGPEITLVFKAYPIPFSIWDKEKVDLLIVTYPTYPNAKMDMFWVNPAISLKNGQDAKGISLVSKCGKNWQQFSWHVNTWNPAHDNLITYLDVVNDRLRRNE